MLDSADTLVRLLHARLPPAATLRLALRLLAARRREVAMPPVPLASRAHLDLQDAEAAADLARCEQEPRGAEWLAEVVAELASLELAAERLDEGAYAALQRSVADQLRGSAEDAELEAQWRRQIPASDRGEEAKPAAPDHVAPRVELEVRHATRLQFAAERNGVPLVESVAITNRGAQALEGLELRLQVGPDFGPPARFALPRLEPGATYTLNAPDVALDRPRLATLLERASGALHVELRLGLAILARQRLPLEILAWNEWTRSLADELLAAFVLPNDPAVAELLAAARDRLRAATGDPSFPGYPRGGRERVDAVVRALAETLPAQQLTYHALPASFEKQGQKLRLPQQLLAHRMGNCIELSLLVAAMLEQAGLHPLLMLVEGHAVVGVWRIADQFPCVTIDHLATVKKLVEVGDLLWIDPTVLVSGGDFDAAVAAANALLDAPERFQKVVDVKAARGAGIVPLPTPGSAALAPHDASTAAEERATPGVTQADGALPLHKPLTDRLTQWKQQLLDLSLRNRLIHWRDSKRCVVLEAGSLAAIEDHLANGGTFDFAPKSVLAAADPRAAELSAARGATEVIAAEQQDLLAQGALLTRHPLDELQTRLLTLFRDDRTHIEETGSSTLFLALGFLEWFESPASTQRRLAPILLLPVTLERRGLARRFTLKLRDDEPRLNDALLEKLKSELDIDPEPLRALPQDDHGVDVAQLLARFKLLVSRVPRFTVVEEARLGFFSFAKYLLWRDLEENSEALLESELVRHLVKRVDGGALPDPAFVDARRLDEVLPPTKARVVLDSDSSQLVAIEAAVRGATFVLQGPPGTGKSQTIANVIAGCIAAGKRVLFVAEKRAALEVVANRLRRAGLASACLELHSQRAAKHEVISELARTLDEAPVVRREDDPLLAERAEKLMRELDEYAAALHRRGPLGMNHFECLGRMVRERDAATLPPLPLRAPLEVDRRGYEERRAAVAELAAAAAVAAMSGPLASHPFAQCGAVDHTPLQARERESLLREFLAQLEASKRALDAAAAALGVVVPPGLPAARVALATLRLLAAPLPGRAAECATRSDLGEVIARLRALAGELLADRAERERLAPRWSERLFELDVAALARDFAQHGDAIAPMRWFKLRGAWSTLTPALRGKAPTVEVTRADLAGALAVVARARRFADEAAFLEATVGAAARGVATEPAALQQVADFLDRWRALVPQWNAAGITTPPAMRALGSTPDATATALEGALTRFESALAALVTAIAVAPSWSAGLASARDGFSFARSTAELWLARLPELRAHARLVRAEGAARALELAPIVDAVRRDELPPASAPAAFERAFFTTVTEHAIGAAPALRDFDGSRHHARALQFRVEDARLIAAGGRRVVAEWGARRTLRADAGFSGSEVEALQREAKKKRRQKSVRWLLSEIPTLLAQLKPCLLMSPQSIAQYLPVSRELFDLVIFDEASQIPTHDAIGALARGRHVVVVGDDKQLPPTAFFERALADDEEEEVAADAPDGGLVRDLESILEEAQAAGVPSLPLRWHYRSRDESLIAFSNRHYYGSRLHTFPAAFGRAQGLGVSLVAVGGTYDKAGRRTNEAEARAIVEWIVAALSDPQRRDQSIGVVTFNQPQQQLIEDLLDAALLERQELQPFAEGGARGEPLFIKNLENVQGDERDTMLFSITYGKDAQGRLSMNFGPLNKRGGERRLNVAITRARERLVVFSSLRADEIDLSRSAAPGVRHLRDYLDYAQRGAIALAAAVVVDAESACESELERDVARALEERGHHVDLQVGCSGYRIDLAIRDPQRPGSHWLGIECDGAAYHSGATARDRDRLRQSVLEGLGWRIHRIWSSDWSERRVQEIERVEAALREARESVEKAEHEAESAKAAQERAASASASPTTRASVVASAPLPAPPVVEPASTVSAAAAGVPAGAEPPLYRSFEVVVAGTRADLDDPGAALRLEELLLRIVDAEAPLHEKPLLQRAARCLGISRMSGAIEEQLEARLAALATAGRLQRRGEFVWSAAIDPQAWTLVRRAAPEEAPRPAEQIAPEERANALLHVLAAGGGGAADDVAAAAARLLGFRSVQSKTRALLRATLVDLAAAGRCELTEDVVRPAPR